MTAATFSHHVRDCRFSRRFFERFSGATVVEGRPRVHHGVDLSVTGALFATDGKDEPPLLHEIVLSLGNSDAIRTKARTVWVRDGFHAVHFVGMNDADRLVIAERIDSRRAR